MMTYEPNYEQRQKINAAAESMWEQILWRIEEDEVSSIEDARDAIYECDWNECMAIGLSMGDRLDLIQEFGPDHDLDLGEVTLDNLHYRIETLTVRVIHHQAEQQVSETLDTLEEIMDDNGLDFEDSTDENPLKYFTHRSEREPADRCTVMEYRDFEEPGQAVDIWEVRLTEYTKLYFRVQAEEVES